MANWTPPRSHTLCQIREILPVASINYSLYTNIHGFWISTWRARLPIGHLIRGDHTHRVIFQHHLSPCTGSLFNRLQAWYTRPFTKLVFSIYRTWDVYMLSSSSESQCNDAGAVPRFSLTLFGFNLEGVYFLSCEASTSKKNPQKNTSIILINVSLANCSLTAMESHPIWYR